MSDHVDRMKKEHKELKTKVEALNTFIHSNDIFKSLDDIERARMIKQSGFMESYLTVLEHRIWSAL
jgi:peptidoglycan hydrolase CwlO-like protein